MIPGDIFRRLLLLQERVALVFGKLEMLLDDALDLADLLQHSLVLGQRDLDVLLENPGEYKARYNIPRCFEYLIVHLFEL